MKTPVSQIESGLTRAYLEIEQPQGGDDPIIPLRFNPTEYQIQKTTKLAEIGIPGLDSPPIQFVRGGAETLSVEFLVDTSDTLEDVRERYVDRLQSLLFVNAELHAPPIVRFVWDRAIFRGVLESMDTTYVLFTPQGIPLRARLSVKIKEYRPVEVQVRETSRSSPDVDKSYTVRVGDTLPGIAAAVYRDPGEWRAIAEGNDIDDPRFLPPGTALNIPALRRP